MQKIKEFLNSIGQWFKSLVVSQNENDSKVVNLTKTEGFKTVLISISLAICGLFLGFVILLIINPSNAFDGIITILKGFLNSSNSKYVMYDFGIVLTNTAPLIMTALAVMFAYKAGLFNIGVAGQYVIGIGVSLWAALFLGLPWFLCIILAMIAGALWGMLPGLLKAYRNVNEVISGIMFNWIALYIVNMLLNNDSTLNKTLQETFSLRRHAPAAIIPSLGLNKIFGNNPFMTISIIIAIVMSVGVFIIMKKTIFGFELRATGSNKNAAKYAGMKEKRNIVMTLAISGALAAIGASLLYLTGIQQYKPSTPTLPAMGFDGISAVFLGGLSPIGLIFSSFFLQHIIMGSSKLPTEFFSREVGNLIIAIIIYLCAFVLFVRQYLKKRKANTKNLNMSIIQNNTDESIKQEKNSSSEKPHKQGVN